MSDEWYSPFRRPPTRSAQLGELFAEFVRASDHALMAIWLFFRGEAYGWESQILERGSSCTAAVHFRPRH